MRMKRSRRPRATAILCQSAAPAPATQSGHIPSGEEANTARPVDLGAWRGILCISRARLRAQAPANQPGVTHQHAQGIAQSRFHPVAPLRASHAPSEATQASVNLPASMMRACASPGLPAPESSCRGRKLLDVEVSAGQRIALIGWRAPHKSAHLGNGLPACANAGITKGDHPG